MLDIMTNDIKKDGIRENERERERDRERETENKTEKKVDMQLFHNFQLKPEYLHDKNSQAIFRIWRHH